ncbi:MAG: hypothetical protein QMD09_09700 [Desulfatibacillaceae bacterium]|nr:hypothetical protein [Desulfatibacillaceae bacterium]
MSLKKGLKSRRAALFAAALVLGAALMAAPVSANYSIMLHSGASFVTEEYWIENNSVVFEYSGGMVRIPRERVASIESTTQAAPAPFGLEASLSGPAAPSASATAAPPARQEAGADIRLPAADAADANRGEDAFQKQFRVLEERFAGLENMEKDDIQILINDLDLFSKELRRSGMAQVYPDMSKTTNNMLVRSASRFYQSAAPETP